MRANIVTGHVHYHYRAYDAPPYKVVFTDCFYSVHALSLLTLLVRAPHRSARAIVAPPCRCEGVESHGRLVHADALVYGRRISCSSSRLVGKSATATAGGACLHVNARHLGVTRKHTIRRVEHGSAVVWELRRTSG
jgi:hypothetical protein